LKRDEEAHLYFREYLTSDDADDERRAYAERTVASLAPTLALVLVESDPSGARIYIDKKEHGSYGLTPKVVAVMPGEREISIELPGYRRSSGKVVAKRGEQVPVRLEPQRIVGMLHVGSPVAGRATVRTAAGETVAAGATPLRVELPPGSYEVGVSAPGRQPWSGLASVEPDQTSELSATLQELPAATGDITVTSNVPGALVELNGEPAGFSPTVLSNVGVGTHRVRVRSPSRVSWQGTLDVKALERSWLTVSLEEPPSTQRSTATWVVAGLGVASLATAGTFGVLASRAHSEFESTPADRDRSAILDRGKTFNTVADAALISGLIATATAVVLYFVTAETRGEPSSASVARSKQ
jgi:outer membrane receptor for ferrienterochelin and colicins